ncbi:hypothetical protein D3C81_1362630 [compost metagenome]
MIPEPNAQPHQTVPLVIKSLMTCPINPAIKPTIGPNSAPKIASKAIAGRSCVSGAIGMPIQLVAPYSAAPIPMVTTVLVFHFHNEGFISTSPSASIPNLSMGSAVE